MKITNVKVEMFNWTTESWKTGVGTTFGSTRQLGIVTVETDGGVSGNAFLGSSRVGADHFAPGLIEFIKPIVMGRNPQDIGAIWWDLWKMNRCLHLCDQHRHLSLDINGRLAADSPASRRVKCRCTPFAYRVETREAIRLGNGLGATAPPANR